MISKLTYIAKSILKQFFGILGVGVTSKTNLSKLKDLENSRAEATLKLLSSFPPEVSTELLNCTSESRSQLQQDLFVLGVLDCKRNGFYVEFGATDGISLSNTYLLESAFGWNGILVEPARNWQKELQVNRPLSNLVNSCVWKTSGEKLKFRETQQKELSTLEGFRNGDPHRFNRLKGNTYEVDTISLYDLLKENNAPKNIDFLSIDTEGSEYEILSSFDFNSYQFSVIACEHNFTENRDRIFELLSSKGYVRVLEKISFFDDWYVLGDLANQVKE